MNIRVLNRPIDQASRLRVVQNHCDAHGCTGCLVRHLAICSALPAEEAAALEQHAALLDELRESVDRTPATWWCPPGRCWRAKATPAATCSR